MSPGFSAKKGMTVDIRKKSVRLSYDGNFRNGQYFTKCTSIEIVTQRTLRTKKRRKPHLGIYECINLSLPRGIKGSKTWGHVWKKKSQQVMIIDRLDAPPNF